MFDLGDGKTAIGVTGEDGTKHEIRVVRLAWMRWWRYGVKGDQPYSWIDEAKVATLTVALGTTLVNDEELAVTLSLTNGEAVAKTLAIDYALAVQER